MEPRGRADICTAACVLFRSLAVVGDYRGGPSGALPSRGALGQRLFEARGGKGVRFSQQKLGGRRLEREFFLPLPRAARCALRLACHRLAHLLPYVFPSPHLSCTELPSTPRGRAGSKLRARAEHFRGEGALGRRNRARLSPSLTSAGNGPDGSERGPAEKEELDLRGLCACCFCALRLFDPRRVSQPSFSWL